jgi:hypothetical protein
MRKALTVLSLRKLLAAVLVIGLVVGGLALWGNSPAQGQGARGKPQRDKRGRGKKGKVDLKPIHMAIRKLNEAMAHLRRAKPVFKGHRKAAMKNVAQALHNSRLALKDHNR